MKKLIALILFLLSVGAQAAPINLFEGFGNLAASGWTIINASAPVGSTSWFQGNSGIFSAQAGAADSYAAANFNATSSETGSISVWLISPEIQFAFQSVSFYARTAIDGFLDALSLMVSTSGASTNPAAFSTLLSIGAGALPTDWTQFSGTLGGIGTGRIAFLYSVGDASNANYIGVDTVRVVGQVVPEPSTLAVLALGCFLLALSLRNARRS